MLPPRLGAGAIADLQLGVIAEKQVIVREFSFMTVFTFIFRNNDFGLGTKIASPNYSRIGAARVSGIRRKFR